MSPILKIFYTFVLNNLNYRFMEYKGELYSIDTLEKAYLLGLLQADGCVCLNKQAQCKYIKLKLKASDKYLLDNICNKWSFFKEPKLEIHKSGKESYYIIAYGKEVFNDLCMNGVLPRKSYENANNSFMPPLSKDLFMSYLLGLLDGDGTVTMDRNRHIRIDLVGKTENLFKDIIERLKEYGIRSTLYYRKDKDYYMIRISLKSSVKTLIEEFKKCPMCLERKFKKFFNIDWSLIPDYGTRKEAIIKSKRRAHIKQGELLEG